MSRLEVIALVLSMAVVGLSFGAAAPLVSALLEQRGLSEYFTGAVSGILAVGIILGSPMAGRWVTRYGARRVNSLGIAGQAVGFLAIGAAMLAHPAWLFPARLLLGAAATMTFVAAEYALLTGTRAGHRGRVMALYGSMLGSGFMLGVFASNPVYERLGLWAFPAIAAVALVVLPLIRFGIRLPQNPPASGTPVETRHRVATLPWRLLALALFGSALFGALDTAFSGAYPVEAMRLGLDRGQALELVGMVALGTVIGQPFSGAVADRIGTRATLVAVCALGLVVALVCGWLATGLPATRPWQAAAFVVLGMAIGGAYPVSLAMLPERVPPQALARANAAFSSAYGWASLLGPVLAAGLIDASIGLGLLGWAVPALCAVVFAVGWPLAWLDRKW
ncbi:MAG: MFS transporter [Gammaproteobacteria bacterium]|nr:MFS transporter [Gammaproteobacteria bacterium]